MATFLPVVEADHDGKPVDGSEIYINFDEVSIFRPERVGKEFLVFLNQEESPLQITEESFNDIREYFETLRGEVMTSPIRRHYGHRVPQVADAAIVDDEDDEDDLADFRIDAELAAEEEFCETADQVENEDD